MKDSEYTPESDNHRKNFHIVNKLSPNIGLISVIIWNYPFRAQVSKILQNLLFYYE